MNDPAPPPSTPTPDAAGAAPARDVPGEPPPGAAGSRGSDPPRRSGHPAARQAGEGAPAAGPSAPSEIDRSTDA